MVRLLKPFGWEMPSSYSAGSQRVKGVLAAPSRGFFLKASKKRSNLETLLWKSQGSVLIFCGVCPKVSSCILQASSYTHPKMLFKETDLLHICELIYEVKHQISGDS